jgi:acyl carrier protein
MTIEERLMSFISSQLKFEGQTHEIAVDTELVKSGLLDSLRVLELAAFIQAEYSVEVNEIDLTMSNFQNVLKIAAYIRDKAEAIASTGEMP